MTYSMLEVWNKIKNTVFLRNFFTVPLWLWTGPIFVLILTAAAFKSQSAVFPLTIFFAAIGLILSSRWKMQGAAVGSLLLIISSIVFKSWIGDALAVYLLFVFGTMTSFLITAYSVEEYESFILAQAEESQKNAEDIKLWQSRFDSLKIKVEREKERADKLLLEFERQEDAYLDKIEHLEKMLDGAHTDLKESQIRQTNIHHELKIAIEERYKHLLAIEEMKEVEVTHNTQFEAFQQEITGLRESVILLEKELEQQIAHRERENTVVETVPVIEEPVLKAPSIEEAVALEETETYLKIQPAETNQDLDEDNIYFSSF